VQKRQFEQKKILVFPPFPRAFSISIRIDGMQPTRILIAYTTNAGSTAEVARMIGEELGKDGTQVDVRRLEEVQSLDPYTAVVVGGPMIVGWHKAALKFIKKHQQALSRIPAAYFFTAKSLTDSGITSMQGVPLALDPTLAKPPKNPARLSYKERYAKVENYLRPALRVAPAVKPVSAAFFAGRLDLYRLKWWQALFVLVVIQAQPGGAHNLPFIQEWAAGMRSALCPS
jgi:menaquinone-dependent protoporphyrinogen IX oxidase